MVTVLLENYVSVGMMSIVCNSAFQYLVNTFNGMKQSWVFKAKH